MIVEPRSGSAVAARQRAVELEPLRRRPVREVRQSHDCSVVVLEGELDLYNSDVVREALARECAHEPLRLVVDLSRVTFLDSTALHVLLGARKLLRDWRGLVVLAPTPAVRRTLQVSGADRVLAVETLGDAVERVRDAPSSAADGYLGGSARA